MDAPAVIDLWTASGLVVPQNDPDRDIQRKLHVDPDLFLVGEVDGLIIATVMAGYEGHRGWVNYLAVAPRYRRQGLGTAMMRKVECLLRERGCPKINLQIRETHQAIRAFYEAVGFTQDHVISMGRRLHIDDG